MKSKFKRILYGGDYNPNQWPEEIWAEDMRIFRDAHINSATINVFSWAKIQPSENVYDFSCLDKMIDMLSRENYDIVLATSTAALPAWMVKKYPEVMSTDYEGRQHHFGQRHNAQADNSFISGEDEDFTVNGNGSTTGIYEAKLTQDKPSAATLMVFDGPTWV